MRIILTIILAITFSSGTQAFASDLDYRNSQKLSPTDYLFGSHGKRRDPVFDEYRTIDLGVDLGISGAECGKLNVSSTLRAALKNILDTKYLGDMGKDILAASPLLVACYFSSTWCSILKHSRLRADFLAQLRMDQCNAIDKYTDSRVEDFYEERAKCVGEAQGRTGGNLEASLDSCKNYHDMDLADWSGGNGKTPENRLIESTAKWAGFKGKEAERVVSLTKAFIGDTIIKKGSIKLDFGPKRVQVTPRTYLMNLKRDTYSALCKGLVQRVVDQGGFKTNIHALISDNELKKISGGSNRHLINRETILSLVYLPHSKREVACQKLSDALAMTVFSDDMGKTHDFVTAKMTTNPHLPKKRHFDTIRKAGVLRDQIEMTLALEKKNSEPLNQVLYQINREGKKYQRVVVQEDLSVERTSNYTKSLEHSLFDCSDGIGCYKDF